MVQLTLQAVATPNKSLIGTNCVYCSASDLAELGVKDGGFIQVKSMVLTVNSDPGVAQGALAFNLVQRKSLQLSLNEPLDVAPWFPPRDNVYIFQITVEVDFPNKARATSNPIDAELLGKYTAKIFQKQCLSVSQDILIDFQGDSLTLRITELQITKGASVPTTESIAATTDTDVSNSPMGLLAEASRVVIGKSSNSIVNLINVQKSSTSSKMFRPDFSFSKMGIGGLDSELGDIFRRAFASRVYPASVLQKMGLMHVRGVLLYGAPGCGKTLIARKIGKMLVDKEPKVVNGPEIFSKYVGGSEENIRNLFADAKAEMQSKGDESELHVIILDEIDAICRQRGTTRGDTGVGDSVVNQLLSFIDGVEALNNILIIGMTNRKDMLDEALLRPGRLEVHVEIGLPDEHGRVQILNIHTKGMKENGFLDVGVKVEDLAAKTKNYTGAEIEGVCKAAASYAFERNIDKSNLTGAPDIGNVNIMMEDFTRAIGEIKPAFGVSVDQLEQCMPNGMLHYGQRFTRLFETGVKFVGQVKESEKTPLLSVLLEGPPGAGKTALAAALAYHADYPYIKFVTAENLVNMSESARCQKLTQAFEDAYRSPLAVVVLDNIERLVSYVKIGPRFSNEILQILLVLIQKRPPKGHRLFVIGTTSNLDVLEQLELAGPQGVFTTSMAVPLLDRTESMSVMKELGCFEDNSIGRCAEEIDSDGIGIKQLHMVTEMAKSEGVISATRFGDCLRSYGL